MKCCGAASSKRPLALAHAPPAQMVVIPSLPAASPSGKLARCLVALMAAKGRELGLLCAAVHADPAFAAYGGNDFAEWLLQLWSRSKLNCNADHGSLRTKFCAREAGSLRVHFLVWEDTPAIHDAFALRHTTRTPCITRLSDQHHRIREPDRARRQLRAYGSRPSLLRPRCAARS